MLDTDIRREFGFERADLGSEDVLTMREHGIHARPELVTDPGLLRCEVDEVHLSPEDYRHRIVLSPPSG